MNKTFRRCSHYTKCEIAGVSYLMPFGQSVADHRSALQINSTGTYLWELLNTERTFGELLKLAADNYKAKKNELPLLKKDLQEFLSALDSHRLLCISDAHMAADHSDQCFSVPDCRYVEIGGLVLQLCGPKEAFSDAFAPFLLSSASRRPHQVVQVKNGAPLFHMNGMILVRNEYLIVSECEGCYLLLFPDSPGLLEAHLEKDGAKVTFYCRPPYTDTCRESLFHAIRFSYLYLAQKHSILALHSASLFYRDRAWLFSGSSGTGKSTHTNLWNRLFKTPLLNGDLNLIKMQDDTPLVYGLPWCGTSGIATSKTYTLGGIILIKQASEDYVEFLSRNQRILLTAQRLISPAWTKAQLQKNLQIAEVLEPHILICRLCCTKGENAAHISKRAIDDYIEKTLMTVLRN